MPDFHAVEQIVQHPVPKDEIDRLKENIAQDGSHRRIAVVLGHGLWSNLDLQLSIRWLDNVLEAIRDILGSNWSGLFVTPNAAGKEKPDDWIVSQGNKALMLFEEAMGIVSAFLDVFGLHVDLQLI